jgi:hypothetical protein
VHGRIHDLSAIPLHAPASEARSPATMAGPTLPLRMRGLTHPLASALTDPGVRFRVPEFSRVREAYTDKTLKIPEAVIKSRVTQLLQRMEKENRLKSKDPVATIIAKIFPSPGTIDEIEFDKAIDTSDRKRIYRSVVDADTKLLPADRPKLQSAMKDAAADVKTVEGDTAGLKQVFGAKWSTAKGNYAVARKVLQDLAASASKLDAKVTTDYNLDDPEVSLGGWAKFSKQRMHLLLDVAQVKDVKETKATVIHEASHLASSSVDDHVYYARGGFFELDEGTKVANAAHYEELPRRLFATSKFDKKTFTPGVTSSGAPVTRRQGQGRHHQLSQGGLGRRRGRAYVHSRSTGEVPGRRHRAVHQQQGPDHRDVEVDGSDHPRAGARKADRHDPRRHALGEHLARCLARLATGDEHPLPVTCRDAHRHTAARQDRRRGSGEVRQPAAERGTRQGAARLAGSALPKPP